MTAKFVPWFAPISHFTVCLLIADECADNIEVAAFCSGWKYEGFCEPGWRKPTKILTAENCGIYLFTC